MRLAQPVTCACVRCRTLPPHAPDGNGSTTTYGSPRGFYPGVVLHRSLVVLKPHDGPESESTQPTDFRVALSPVAHRYHVIRSHRTALSDVFATLPSYGQEETPARVDRRPGWGPWHRTPGRFPRNEKLVLADIEGFSREAKYKDLYGRGNRAAQFVVDNCD